MSLRATINLFVYLKSKCNQFSITFSVPFFSEKQKKKDPPKLNKQNKGNFKKDGLTNISFSPQEKTFFRNFFIIPSLPLKVNYFNFKNENLLFLCFSFSFFFFRFWYCCGRKTFLFPLYFSLICTTAESKRRNVAFLFPFSTPSPSLSLSKKEELLL